MDLYYAYPIVAGAIIFTAYWRWSTDSAIDAAVKTALFILVLWSGLDAADRLDYMDVYRATNEVERN